ncbi:MAG: hypothetical protein HQ512_13290 [Rhodospirillales bacterium]|nr:hypothetical protein [Rhodospirillales bacterium]
MDLPSIITGRAAAQQNLVRVQRELQEQLRLKGAEKQQNEAAKANRALEQQAQAARRRQQDELGDYRTVSGDRRLRNAQALASNNIERDRDNSILRAEINEEVRQSRADSARLAEPNLTPRRDVNELAADPSQAFQGPLTPSRPVSDLADPNAVAASLGALRPFEPVEGPNDNLRIAFEANEQSRSQRLAERRSDDQVSANQQQADLALANRRIATVQFNAELPRGSIVNVSG